MPDRPRNWGRWRDLDIVGTLPRQQTFSLGVYRYVSKTDGGLKRGPVVARFPGSFAENPRVAFENAEAKCRELEER